MKLKFLLSSTLVLFFVLAAVNSAQSQTKEELQELLNSESKPTKQKKEKPKEEKKQETKPAKEEKPKAEEKKKEEPKAEEKKKEEPKQETKTETKPAGEEKPKAEEKKKEDKPSSTETKPKSGAKLKELPDPNKVGWRRGKRLGDKLTSYGSIYNALKYYEAAVSRKPTKQKLYQRAADANFALRDYASADKYYKILTDMDSVKHKNLYAVFQYALTEKYLGKYENSKAIFQKFNKLAGSIKDLDEIRKNASREIAGCDLGIKFRDSKEPRTFKVTHIDSNINQPFTDYGPTLVKGNTLYYGSWVSDKVILVDKREKYADYSRIYTAVKNGNTWLKSSPVKGGVNNGDFHSGNPTLTADGNTMYYTQCLQDIMSRMRCDIYKSNLENGEWGTGAKLNNNVNADGATTTHPSIGKNEEGDEVLFFASDRNTSKGMDLFYSKINKDGTYGKAHSVGPAINTKGDEKTPYYDFKTSTLYFTSNGHINIGGEDVFKTHVENGEWVQAENVGMPVNSSVDDEYFRWYEEQGMGFVVSNRPGGYGLKSATCCDDIYEVVREKIYLALRGYVQNADSNLKRIENALVTLYDNASGKEVKNFYAADGSYFFDLEPDKDYVIMARKNGFDDYKYSYSTEGKRMNDTATFDFALKMIPKPATRVGEKIGVVYWEFNKDYLTDGAPDTLKSVVQFMNDNPQYILEVGSHTDAKGSDEYNLKLSQRRSDAVLKFLLSKKVPNIRLISKAYGESVPVAQNENADGSDNAEGRTQNRRTEFKIVDEKTAEQFQQMEQEQKAKTKKSSSKK